MVVFGTQKPRKLREVAWVHGCAGRKLAASPKGHPGVPSVASCKASCVLMKHLARVTGSSPPVTEEVQAPRNEENQVEPPTTSELLRSLSSQGHGSIGQLLSRARGCTEVLTCEEPRLPRLHSSGTLAWPGRDPCLQASGLPSLGPASSQTADPAGYGAGAHVIQRVPARLELNLGLQDRGPFINPFLGEAPSWASRSDQAGKESWVAWSGEDCGGLGPGPLTGEF